jgi:hypothetical protein
MNDDQLPIEVYFLKYAFPCAFITLQRGRLTQEEFDQLENAALNNEVLDRKWLEKIFVPAFRRMSRLAEEKKMEVWSHELMREYYYNRHNEIIDAREESYKYAPEILCELCKVLRAEVIGTNGENAVVKLPGGKKRPVMNLCGKLKKGDKVMVHYGYAVELVA